MTDSTVGLLESRKVPRYVTEQARQLRKGQTSAEEILWSCLRNRRLFGAKFRRQQPIGRYIADFYCHEAQLAVEVKGGIHNSATHREYDDVRELVIEQLDIRILSFTNEEVTQNLEATLERIKDALTLNSPPA